MNIVERKGHIPDPDFEKIASPQRKPDPRPDGGEKK
jgi:hypothetical protein